MFHYSAAVLTYTFRLIPSLKTDYSQNNWEEGISHFQFGFKDDFGIREVIFGFNVLLQLYLGTYKFKKLLISKKIDTKLKIC